MQKNNYCGWIEKLQTELKAEITPQRYIELFDDISYNPFAERQSYNYILKTAQFKIDIGLNINREQLNWNPKELQILLNHGLKTLRLNAFNSEFFKGIIWNYLDIDASQLSSVEPILRNSNALIVTANHFNGSDNEYVELTIDTAPNQFNDIALSLKNQLESLPVNCKKISIRIKLTDHLIKNAALVRSIRYYVENNYKFTDIILVGDYEVNDDVNYLISASSVAFQAQISGMDKLYFIGSDISSSDYKYLVNIRNLMDNESNIVTGEDPLLGSYVIEGVMNTMLNVLNESS